jgi:TonB family protein
LARRDLRGGSFQQSQKKSSSGLAVFLLLLLLGSLGFSFYIYQENTEIAGENISVKINNADLSNQIKKSTAKISPLENKIKDNQYLIETLEYEYGLLDKEKADLEIINSDLEEMNKELERVVQILVDTNNKPLTTDDGQIPDQITLHINSLRKDNDELSTKAAALETIINNKNSEILDLQVQLAQSSSQIDDLSDEVTELKIQLSIPIISRNPPKPVSNLPQPVKSCNSNNAILQKRPAPVYPRRAIQRDIEGVVKVKFDVSTSGNTINVIVISSSNSILSSAAINAAKKLIFKPAEDCDGNFVIDREVTTSYRFSLN